MEPNSTPTTPVVNSTAPGQELEILPPPPNLADLARQAREAHAATSQAVSEAVRHALAAGRALIAARKLIPEGQWTRWVKRNCEFSDRHARRYIALAEAYAASGHSVSGDVLGLSLRKALKRLTHPKVTTARKRSTPTKTTGLDIVTVWKAAPPAERTRALNNIGLRPLLEALPQDWLPSLERWIDERRAPAVAMLPAPTPLVGNDPGEVPESLVRTPKAEQQKVPLMITLEAAHVVA